MAAVPPSVRSSLRARRREERPGSAGRWVGRGAVGARGPRRFQHGVYREDWIDYFVICCEVVCCSSWALVNPTAPYNRVRNSFPHPGTGTECPIVRSAPHSVT